VRVAHVSARSASPPSPPPRTSPSCASCCGPPASRSSASCPAARTAASQQLPRLGQAGGAEGSGRRAGRERDRLRRRALAAAGAHLEGALGHRRRRPHRDHPRHLRRHAGSAEGKLQVELAQLEYNLARMRGLWSHLERLGGGVGTRGPGETQIETDRRLARNRIAVLRGACATCTLTRGDAQRARTFGAAADRTRRLHQRRQVDTAQRTDGIGCGGRRPALPDARPDDSGTARSTAAPTC
jgi:hypothetical protein